MAADILSPLIGNTEHHITNSQTFVERIKDLKLEPDESIVSFDVSALFTSITVNEAITVVRELLESDDTWKKETAENLDVDSVIQLLAFCLNTTYFVFRGKFYQQKDGCAMGSPCNPSVANAYMEFFETKALSLAPHPPRLFLRYVTYSLRIHQSHQQAGIRTFKSPGGDGQLSFPDTLIVRVSDGNVKIKIFRKSTNTKILKYLSFESPHPLEHKLSVVKTLIHRSEIVMDPSDKEEEVSHIKSALRSCGYRDWTCS
ncbi:uncharacterized protein [Amphiura filiformis]|uniref:uncharacterized protein n=1 Tax=Amphiura filiformis TaxID=82378 RepID=UPI003B219390